MSERRLKVETQKLGYYRILDWTKYRIVDADTGEVVHSDPSWYQGAMFARQEGRRWIRVWRNRQRADHRWK